MSDQRLRPQVTTIAEILTVDPDVSRLYASIMPDMWQFYTENGRMLPDAELLVSLDREFGRRIITKVCEPLGIFDGGCLFVALVLLRQKDIA
jgi:hypothetical protein